MMRIFNNSNNSKNENLVIFTDKRIAKNTFSLSIIYAFNFLISLITLPHLIKSYGIFDWGNIVFYQIILNYHIWVIDWSFNQYSTKFISINSENKLKIKKIFNETKCAQLILLSFTLLLSFILLITLGESKLITLFWLILFGNFLQSFWFLNGIEKIYETAFIQLLNKLFLAIMIILLIDEKSNIYFYFFFIGISSLITGIICQLLIKYKYDININIKNYKKGLRTIIKSSKLYFSSILGFLNNSSLPLLISILIGKEQLGIYNIAERIKGISVQLANPITHSLFPRMSKEYSQDKQNANKLLQLVLITLLSLTFIAFIFINIFINQIVAYFSNENISLISGVLKILLFSFIINVVEEVMVNHYLMPNGMYNSINKLKFIILSISILSCFPLIFKYGIIGAAYANLISELIGFLFIIFIYYKTYNLEYKKEYF